MVYPTAQTEPGVYDSKMYSLRECHLPFTELLQRNQAECIFNTPFTFLFSISTYILEESEWKIVNKYSGTIWIIMDKMLHLSEPLFHL